LEVNFENIDNYMPTYEYKCKKCNGTFEFFQSMKDEPLKFCPKCKGELKRLIGAGAPPIFKGSGFYETDYKRSSAKPDVKTPKKTDSKIPTSSGGDDKKSTGPKKKD
jgi:putative FmdB family regulatory protein